MFGEKRSGYNPKNTVPTVKHRSWEYYAVDVEKEEYVKILKKISSCKQQN